MPEPRKPQDHKAKAVESDVKPEGWDLLKPFDQVAVWDQAELLEIVKPLMASSDVDGEDLDLMSFDVTIIGQLARKLADLAVDSDEYTRFVSGPDALGRAVNLGIAYAGQLGKSGDSATS